MQCTVEEEVEVEKVAISACCRMGAKILRPDVHASCFSMWKGQEVTCGSDTALQEDKLLEPTPGELRTDRFLEWWNPQLLAGLGHAPSSDPMAACRTTIWILHPTSKDSCSRLLCVGGMDSEELDCMIIASGSGWQLTVQPPAHRQISQTRLGHRGSSSCSGNLFSLCPRRPNINATWGYRRRYASLGQRELKVKTPNAQPNAQHPTS
ncbi:hypothetical protein EDD22DRAFT_849920 [Suillus occidentalis]|nr:hypothetical protein EDD22DRAFT_849920 [Suillus occidentalis]